MSKAEILTLNQSDAWRETLARVGGDVYYEPAYLRALAQRGEGEPILFAYQDDRGAAAHAVL
ncbi:MAG: hypothetical protein ACTSXZ_10150, partial [Alphaproteobacteria bacterium]